jgi:hypothetical protein
MTDARSDATPVASTWENDPQLRDVDPAGAGSLPTQNDRSGRLLPEKKLIMPKTLLPPHPNAARGFAIKLDFDAKLGSISATYENRHLPGVF